ncbi:MAG: hypothetical protein FLDDKLPJ_01337 [Phycisphaerae bacterium]|nr:hypothetical protein [Phycisphaerae bacterium]
MDPVDLVAECAGIMERLGIPYLVTGSIASIYFGEPRLTNDVDIVLALTPGKIAPFCASFPQPPYYVSDEAVRDAVARHAQFNVIHSEAGLKADFMIAADSEFNRSRFARRSKVQIGPQASVMMASPEDVIIKKLEYFRERGSDKRLRDIVGILKLCPQPIDTAYILEWVDRLGLRAEWKRVRTRAGMEP